MENYTKKDVKSDGCVYYYNSKNEYHRLDDPAKEHPNGSKAWCINNKFHRLDGPAVEWGTGEKFWYLKDKYFTKSGHNRMALFFTLEPRRIVLE